MGPGGGPTKMYENPRVSRPLPLIWGWVFDAAAPALVPALGALPPPSTRRAFFDPVSPHRPSNEAPSPEARRQLKRRSIPGDIRHRTPQWHRRPRRTKPGIERFVDPVGM